MAYGMFRTIWISLRATDYTTRAFTSLRKSMGLTITKEYELQKATARNITRVGMIFMAMGLVAVNAITGIIQKSKYGARMLERFGKRVDRALAKLGDRLAKALEPVFNIIIGLIETITSLPFAEWFIIGATGVLILGGALLVVTGALKLLLIDLPLIIGLIKIKLIPTIIAWATSLWHAASAMSVLTFGAAALAGAAAIGVAIAASQAIRPEYQMGTAFVRKGGMAVVHGGEEIKSARETRRPSLIERKGPIKRIYNVRIDVGHLHTKADKEEMFDVIREAIRKAT